MYSYPILCFMFFATSVQKYLDEMSVSATPLATNSVPSWANRTATSDVLEHLLEPVQELLRRNYDAVGVLEMWDDSTLPLFNRAVRLPNFDWEVQRVKIMWHVFCSVKIGDRGQLICVVFIVIKSMINLSMYISPQKQ